MHDHEIVAFLSTILGILLTVIKFFFERKKTIEVAGDSAWVKFKRGVLILFVGFLIGIATCFYLFVGSDWKAKKAFHHFFKKHKSHWKHH